MLNPKSYSSENQKSSSHSKNERTRTPKNKDDFNAQLSWFQGDTDIFSKMKFHGNTKWQPENLASQALIFSWSEKSCVTDAFDESLKRCGKLGIPTTHTTYQGFMGALANTRQIFMPQMTELLHQRIETLSSDWGTVHGYTPIAFDGSRSSLPRTESNEAEFCASNYGSGKTAKYRKKKTKGMRRVKNEKNPSAAPKPQAWITMMTHMGLRLPWSWRLGPSNSSERLHVMEMLENEDFPPNTLFCGDAGFIGHDFWRTILNKKMNFIVRVGANVSLLSTNFDYETKKDGVVYCWPRGKQNKQAPLKLRLVKVKLGKTKIWLLTSVLDKTKLSKKMMIRFYEMRWGVEVEFRGLKQTLNNSKLCCRNALRAYAELDWSIMALAVAKLFALKEQLAKQKSKSKPEQQGYDPQDLSLANTMRAIENCLDELNERPATNDDLFTNLAKAMTDNYTRKSKKGARYRPKNPDKKPLGDPKVRRITSVEKEKTKFLDVQNAA